MIDGATSKWSLQTYHEASDHRNLHDLKLIWPFLKNVDRLPICDACLSQSLRKPYTKMGNKTRNKNNDGSEGGMKYQFIPFKNQLPFSKTEKVVDINDSLSHPTASDAPELDNRSTENQGGILIRPERTDGR